MIEVYFDNIEHIILKELYKAKCTIRVAVAWFTNEVLYEALLSLCQRGISIEIVINDDEINKAENNLDFSLFLEEGGNLYWATLDNLMHQKFCVIDETVVINGSYNWTNKAETQNQENIIVVKQEILQIKKFIEQFDNIKNQCIVDKRHKPNKIIKEKAKDAEIKKTVRKKEQEEICLIRNSWGGHFLPNDWLSKEREKFDVSIIEEYAPDIYHLNNSDLPTARPKSLIVDDVVDGYYLRSFSKTSQKVLLCHDYNSKYFIRLGSWVKLMRPIVANNVVFVEKNGNGLDYWEISTLLRRINNWLKEKGRPITRKDGKWVRLDNIATKGDKEWYELHDDKFFRFVVYSSLDESCVRHTGEGEPETNGWRRIIEHQIKISPNKSGLFDLVNQTLSACNIKGVDLSNEIDDKNMSLTSEEEDRFWSRIIPELRGKKITYSHIPVLTYYTVEDNGIRSIENYLDKKGHPNIHNAKQFSIIDIRLDDV